jgi:hypothetical protein
MYYTVYYSIYTVTTGGPCSTQLGCASYCNSYDRISTVHYRYDANCHPYRKIKQGTSIRFGMDSNMAENDCMART